MTDHYRDTTPLPTGRIALVALFVTALVTAQLTASKLLGFSIPFELPFTGALLVMPGAALAYAVTFFASDCYSELYGPEEAHKMVNVGFAMNFVLLALVYSTIAAPAAPFSTVDPATFERVLGASLNIVVASLLAYVVSQHWDVRVFHAIREATDGDSLWIRNVGSTASSQLIDTLIFVFVGFAAMPALRGGDPMTTNALLGLVVGQYVLKLLIAVADTPFVYAVVGYFRSRGSAAPAPRTAD
ncbi:queuosine precursor transporter [Halorussus gelatinilyticus]|uniref:Probable queuosine precursor transporter n=1 Tax=Halorussus gelatinilyticus TaxID=2937524 RepID=A0A8U0IL86_9EURY|nr:queuosine precursor transporter [Halorussus gelatinilyticus]UPW01538.1 queuosine precursor transporter [Halorussus gelatinilyticus]